MARTGDAAEAGCRPDPRTSQDDRRQSRWSRAGTRLPRPRAWRAPRRRRLSGRRSASGDPRCESPAHRLGRDQRERDVAELVLDPPLARVGVSIEAERLAVELVGPLQVLDWNGDEIGSLHAEISQPTLPSEAGSAGSSRPRTRAAAPS